MLDIFPNTYSRPLIDEVQTYGLPWFRAGTLIWRLRDDELEFLLVREAKVKIDGVWQRGNGGWNLPCGRVGVDHNGFHTESLAATARREALEETGQTVRLGPICHIGQRTDLNNPYLIVIFSATIDEFVEFTPTEEVAEIAWHSRSELDVLAAAHQLRNTELTFGAIDAFIDAFATHRHQDGLTPTTYRPKL